MEVLSRNLRRRAKELGLSDAEVARRAGLSERRYGHYVAGTREPDFATFLRICEVLVVRPDELLLPEEVTAEKALREKALERIQAALSTLDEREINLAIRLISAIRDVD